MMMMMIMRMLLLATTIVIIIIIFIIIIIVMKPQATDFWADVRSNQRHDLGVSSMSDAPKPRFKADGTSLNRCLKPIHQRGTFCTRLYCACLGTCAWY